MKDGQGGGVGRGRIEAACSGGGSRAFRAQRRGWWGSRAGWGLALQELQRAQGIPDLWFRKTLLCRHFIRIPRYDGLLVLLPKPKPNPVWFP